jgi:hypothetical protein
MDPPNKEMDEKKSITIHIKDMEQTKQNEIM